MEKIFKACLLFLLLVVSGCTFLSVLDKETPEETLRVQQELQLQCKQRNIEFNQKYVGLTKEEVRKEWGKPKFVNFNVRYCIKPNGDCDWHNKIIAPDIRVAEEQWVYYKKFNSTTDCYWYSVSFYFVEGKVVKVASA